MKLRASVNGDDLADRVERRPRGGLYPCRAVDCGAKTEWRDGWCWHHHPENRAAVRLNGFALKEARRKKIAEEIEEGIQAFLAAGGRVVAC